MPRKQFDLIVFDWDGTLIDSTALIVQSIQGAARDLGLPVPSDADAAYVIGLGLPEALQKVFPALEPTWYARIVERYRYHYLLKDHVLPLFPGVQAMLEELKESAYFLAVATGKNRVGLNRSLDSVGLSGLFDTTRCADETFSKPHPAMLLEITRDLGQDMRRTVMIGDTTHDLQMASNAGAHAIAVEYGAHEAVELQSMQPLFSAKSVTELHQWLAEHA